jgi:hypothetical protein
LVADQNTPLVEALRRARATDAKLAERIIPDRVHPGPGGHLLMAAAVLKAWGATPLVTRVEIDAASGKLIQALNSTVTGIEKNAGLRWNQTDAALPMPVNMNDPVVALAVKSSDFVQALNQQSLRVTGLTGASYTLKINGAAVGTFSREQLDAGINLAELPTPMAKQAAGAHALTLKRSDVHNARWRQIQVPFQKETLPRLESILSNLDALDEELATRQRAAAQPSQCFYELIP